MRNLTIPSATVLMALSAFSLHVRAEQGVAQSGMSQGSGAITTRSDVTMSVESLPGTSAMRLGAIGEAIGTQMTAIRQCYADVTSERPTVEGTLQIRVRIAADRGATTLEVAQDTTGDQALTDCVTGAIRRAPLMRVPGPSGGMVVIQFQNTAAEGAAIVAREQQQATAAVQTVDGQPQAEGGTPQNEVRLTVTGTGDTSADAVSVLFRSAQARVGMMLDCRRRASRREMNPEGEIVIALRVPARGRANGRRTSSTVADPNAPQCVLRALQQAARGESAAAGSYRISIRFAPR